MSAMDKAKNVAEDLKGKVKEATGSVTDDEHMETEGQVDQGKADAKQRGEQLKDAGGDVKDAFKN